MTVAQIIATANESARQIRDIQDGAFVDVADAYELLAERLGAESLARQQAETMAGRLAAALRVGLEYEYELDSDPAPWMAEARRALNAYTRKQP